MRGLAYAGQHADAVFGTGSLDVARYGHVLRVAAARRRARRRRGVRRPLLRHVGHPSTLKRGEFTQSFALARNGLLSTLPAVPA